MLFGAACLAVFAIVAGVGIGLEPLANMFPWSEDDMVSIEEVAPQRFDTGPAPRLVIETYNGNVDVRAGAPDEVAIAVTRRASGLTPDKALDELGFVEVRMTHEDGTVRVIARRAEDAPGRGNSGARVQVTAPPGASVSLRTSNGKVTVTAIEGTVQALSSNGAVAVAGSHGPVIAESSNGRIRVETAPWVPALVQARTSSGSIEFEGALGAGESTFTTSNGSVELKLPKDAQFALSASTSNGKIRSGFRFEAGGRISDRLVEAAVGAAPAAIVRIQTSNGSVSVEPAK